jgi:hypothetical protein
MDRFAATNSFGHVWSGRDALAPIFNAVSGLAWLIWCSAKGGFLPWLFPARLWMHKSTSADFSAIVMEPPVVCAGLFFFSSRLGIPAAAGR